MPSQIYIDFIRTNLRRFLNDNETGPGGWSARKFSDYSYTLYSAEKISSTISNDTVSRLLSYRGTQSPTKRTCDTIAEILIIEGVILKSQIDSIHYSNKRVFEVPKNSYVSPPKTKKFQEFLQDISKRYFGIYVDERNVRSSLISLYYESHSDTIEVLEESLTLKDWSKREIDVINDLVNSNDSFLVYKKMLDFEDLCTRCLRKGFAFISSNFLFIVLNNNQKSQPSSLSAHDITLAEDDSVIGISMLKNSGIFSFRDHILNRIKFFQNPIRDELRVAKINYVNDHSYFVDYTNKVRQIMCPDSSFEEEKLTYRKNYHINLSMYLKIFGNNDELLKKSLEDGDIFLFKYALSRGANPNICWPEPSTPLICELAANGRLQWIKALIESELFDINVTDRDGLPPSHHSTMAALVFSPSSVGPVSAEAYSRHLEISEVLHRLERQSRSKQYSPKMP